VNTTNQIIAFEYLTKKITGLWQSVGTVFEMNGKKPNINFRNFSKSTAAHHYREFKITNEKGDTLLKTTYDGSGVSPKYSIETATLKAEVNNHDRNSKVTLTEHIMGSKLSEIQYASNGKQIITPENQLKMLEPFTKDDVDAIIDKFKKDMPQEVVQKMHLPWVRPHITKGIFERY